MQVQNRKFGIQPSMHAAIHSHSLTHLSMQLHACILHTSTQECIQARVWLCGWMYTIIHKHTYWYIMLSIPEADKLQCKFNYPISFVVWACWYLLSTSVFTMNDCTSNHCFLEKGNYYWQISQNLATVFPLLLPPRPFLPSVGRPLITNIETVIIRITEPHSPEAISSL